MGNYKFRLSDMMPNAWFYKLKDMSKPKNHANTITKKKQHSSPSKTKQQPHNQFYPRKSYYFPRELIPSDGFYVPQTNTQSSGSHHLVLDPPRKSSQKRSQKRNISSSVTAGCRFRAKPDSTPQYSASTSSEDESSSPKEHWFDCILTTPSLDNMLSFSKPKDSIIHDDDHKNSAKNFDKKLDDFDNLSEHQLPRIITKTVQFNYTEKDIKRKKSSGRKFSVISPGVRLRMNSPKNGRSRIQGHARKSTSSSSSSSSRKILSDSFAVVKSSFDPQRDFKESMVEMIMENNIRTSKDLEDLLACYLSLNSNEYHHLIIKVFKQIWFDLNDVRLK